MKYSVKSLRAALTALALLAAPAWADDALWANVTASTKQAQQLVAGDIDLVLAAAKGSAPLPAARHFRLHLSGWAQGKPVYASTEIDALPGAKGTGESSIELIKSVSKVGYAVFEPDAKVTRADGQPRDGKSWSVFKLRDEGVGRKIAATVWVDVAASCPHQIDTDLHIALYVDGTMKTSYALDDHGRCVAQRMEAEFAVIVPFSGMKMKFTQTSSNWVAQPARL
ncbi:MAG: hypothetical protein V4484_00065 [Pseudomonadota bacterium]